MQKNLLPASRLAWIALGTSLLASLALAFDCSLTSIGVTPLNDMGPATYAAGHIGGLYPNGLSHRPAAHEAAGLAISQAYIVPRSAAGAADPLSGKIGLISIGMSNTSQEFTAFVATANLDPAKDPRVMVVNGAQGGQPASAWTSPTAPTWDVLAQRIQAAGLTNAQVQVAWIKHAEAGPSQLGPFPAHAQVLQADLEAIVRNLRAAYPNVRMAYLSSRTRSYEANPNQLNPEPYAFESGFSVRWLIEQQLDDDPNLDFDPIRGVAPWLSWGPYLWADGTVPRSDGFTWLCSDLQADFTHPSATGQQKVAAQLLAFFKTDPTTAPWFLNALAPGQPPALAANADITAGSAPITVQFSAQASDPDGSVVEYVWTFADGGFSYEQNPTKAFPVPGTFVVVVTAGDDDGNTASQTITITADGGAANPPVIQTSGALTQAAAGQPFQQGLIASGTLPITWSVTLGTLPPGMTLASDGVYAGTPTTPGTYAFTVEATNAAGADSAPLSHTIVPATAPIELLAEADAYVRDAALANQNFGTENQLLVRGAPANGNAISYLRFDLSQLPSPCTQAVLRLHLQGVNGTQGATVKLFSVMDDAWGETTLTWNNRPAPIAQLDVVALGVAGTVHEFDVGAALAAEWTGDGVLSLCVLDDATQQTLAAFASRETPVPPRLVVACGSGCPTGAINAYGDGFPGTFGVPPITATPLPTLGAPITITIGNSAGIPTSGILLLGVLPLLLPGSWGGDLLVDPLVVIVLPSIPPAGLPLTGSLSSDPSLCGANVHLQALVIDAGAAKGASSSRGLQLVIGG